MPQIEKETGRFGGLLAAQLVFIFLIPFVGETGSGRLFLYLGIFGLLAAGVYTASSERASLGVSLAILLPVLFAWLGPHVFDDEVEKVMRMLTPAIAYGFTVVVVLRDVSRHERVTSNTILGGINVYLLLAFAFMLLHAAVMIGNPQAYTIGGESLKEQLQRSSDSYGLASLLYFSFTTLTTLGYGDIVPAGAFSRLLTSAEAVIGQLYVAIFIGRLVGLTVSSRMEPD